jgi:hypothetical protein
VVLLVTAAKETATATMEHKKSTSRKKSSFAFRIHEHGKSLSHKLNTKYNVIFLNLQLKIETEKMKYIFSYFEASL